MPKPKKPKRQNPDEVTFDVIDLDHPGKPVDLDDIAEERWTSSLSALAGWALMDDGTLIVCDDEGAFEFAPERRFAVKISAS